MSKYRFKTKEEFINDKLWSSIGTPLLWATSGIMNDYLGKDIPNEFIDNIENDESFHISSWTFRANNCILKDIETKIPSFEEGDIVEVIRTTATNEEWALIGRIGVEFKIGEKFKVNSIFKGGEHIQFKTFGSWYPSTMFKLSSRSKVYSIDDFQIGQKVKVISLEAPDSDWNKIGKIPIKFKLEEILTIKNKGNYSLQFQETSTSNYPICMFEPYDELISTEDRLIAEAKKRYPIGTIFYPVHVNAKSDFCIITSNEFLFISGNIYSIIHGKNICDFSENPKYGNTSINRMIYEKGKWADITTEILTKPSSSISLVGKFIVSVFNHESKLPYGTIYEIQEEDKDFITCKIVGPLHKNRILEKSILVFDTLKECYKYLSENLNSLNKEKTLTILTESLSTNPCCEVPLDTSIRFTTKPRGITLIEPISIKKRLKF